MKKMNLVWAFIMFSSVFCACDKELIEYGQGDLKVSIESGDEWLHDFSLFLGMKRKNPPQIAVWVEDLQGNYLSTVYVTHKIATQSWSMSGGNRRKEALPHWCYARGVEYEDGLYLPTKKHPLTDGISGATPQEGFEVKLRPATALQRFVVKVEINHSTDFNECYPDSAKEGETNYSGGKKGSGQPAVVYAALIDRASGQDAFEATLIGHSSPDGNSGAIFEDVTGLTTALHIVKQITIQIQ